MTTMFFNQMALQDFEHAVSKAFWRDRISQWTRKSNDLLSFDKMSQCLSPKGQHYLGLQVVPVDNIVGSEGRYRDFDRAFFPRQKRVRDRWVSIAKAHYEQAPLPPVELFKIGKAYFVRDGNHRVSVARTHGQDFIDANVTEIDVPGPVKLSKKCQFDFPGL
jgi:hypothetical protein